MGPFTKDHPQYVKGAWWYLDPPYGTSAYCYVLVNAGDDGQSKFWFHITRTD